MYPNQKAPLAEIPFFSALGKFKYTYSIPYSLLSKETCEVKGKEHAAVIPSGGQMASVILSLRTGWGTSLPAV